MPRSTWKPAQGLRDFTTVLSYNFQHANDTRLRTWAPEFLNCYVAMQGTQRTYHSNKDEKTLQQWCTDTHVIYEHKVQRRKGPQSEGVLIMAPRGMETILKKVLLPSDKDLEGRAMAVWFSRGLYDICIVSVYCPLGDRDPVNHKKTEKLWHWVSSTRNSIPRRVYMVIGTDANGHVGSIREHTLEQPFQDHKLERSEEDYIHIGPHGPEVENTNGTIMREFLERENMVATNTKCPMACGKTWSGGKGATTRVDYIIVDAPRLHVEDKIMLSSTFRRKLRTMACLEVNDHVPLGGKFRYRAPHRYTRPPPPYDDEAIVRSCITWHEKAIAYSLKVNEVFEHYWMKGNLEGIGPGRDIMDQMADMAWTSKKL